MKSPRENPETLLVTDFATLQAKWDGIFEIGFYPEVKDRLDASAAALNQLIADIGAETLKRYGLKAIFISPEMHVGSGAYDFSVNHTLKENIKFLCGRLGLPLPNAMQSAKTEGAADGAAEEPAAITPEDLFGDPKTKLRKKIRMVIAATIATCLGGAAGGVSWHLTRPDEITTNCSIRFIPETEGYRVSCAVTRKEALKPRLQFRKDVSPTSRLAGLYEADVSFAQQGRICISKRSVPVIPRNTTKLPAEAFTCVAPPLTRAAPPLE